MQHGIFFHKILSSSPYFSILKVYKNQPLRKVRKWRFFKWPLHVKICYSYIVIERKMKFLSGCNYFLLLAGSIIITLSAKYDWATFFHIIFKMAAKYALTGLLTLTEIQLSTILGEINCNMGYFFHKMLPPHPHFNIVKVYQNLHRQTL